MIHKILAINPGSTSTKIGVFYNDHEVWSKNIIHSAAELAPFTSIMEQYGYRLDKMKAELNQNGYALSDFDAFVARGGLLKPLEGGTYKIAEPMLRDLETNRYGAHASNLGALLAHQLGVENGKESFIVDPVVVDELDAIARITGLPDMEKRSIFHALNQKAIARRFASNMNSRYEDYNLIIAHLGGGISVGCHKKGRVVEVNNALSGDGPFSPERTGSIQAQQFADMILSRQLSKDMISKTLAGRGGLVAHLGTNDAREVERRIHNGDQHAELIYQAMIYQVARSIAAAAIPVKGEVDFIIITGGMAHSRYLTDKLTDYIKFIAPVEIYPGEDELKALAEGALRIVKGEEEYKAYC